MLSHQRNVIVLAAAGGELLDRVNHFLAERAGNMRLLAPRLAEQVVFRRNRLVQRGEETRP
jgi:hypothetical protein